MHCGPVRPGHVRRDPASWAVIALWLAATVSGTGPALAQDNAPEPEMTCANAVGGALKSNPCALEAWQMGDDELNRVYQRLRANLPATGLAPPNTRDAVLRDLTATQKLWVQLRDTDCTLLQNLSGGGNTGHFDIEYDCYRDRTLKRIEELQAIERMIGP